MVNLKRFFHSLRDAARGLALVFKTEQNFRLQLLVGTAAVLLALYFRLPVWQVVFVIFLAVMVLTMELLNTALEYFTDLLKPRLHHYVSVIKDIMAAAVLVTSFGALFIGLIIFIPHFIRLLK